MANRIKEDDKNEKIIRGLLKIPANRRCINCNSLGPQYVCTNFSTFICTNCSGIHREFTHRVKSISMAKFTSQEVSALQEGGNERAKEIYFKEWDPQRHSFPDSSNGNRVRDFIKHVYVDRRYTGERSVDRPPRVKGDREDSYESRRSDTRQGGLRSPSYDEALERRYGEQPGFGARNDERNYRYGYEERRSPAYDQVDHKRSPGRFEVVDDRRRDDRFVNSNQNRRFEDRKSAEGVPKSEGRSPNHQKEMSSPPIVRPVREILGEDIPPLRVGEPPKSNGASISVGFAKTERNASSSSMGSVDGNVVLKRVNSGTLIDLAAGPEQTVAEATQQSVSQETKNVDIGGDWASFDLATSQKATQPPAEANSLESALAELAGSGASPVSNASMSSADGINLLIKNTKEGQFQVMQQNQASLFPPANSHSAAPTSNPVVSGALDGQLWASAVAPNLQGDLTASTGQPSQVASNTHLPTGTGAPFLSYTVETKTNDRKELPADLFAATYPSAFLSVPVWQTIQHVGMGFSTQYPVAAAMPSFPNSSKTINPFDLGNESMLPHATSLPSMASLQGALPNLADPSPLLRSSSYGRWVTPQQSPYASAASPSTFMLQQPPRSIPQQASNNMLPVGHQGLGSFGSERAAFGVSGMMDPHLTGGYSQTGTPNYPSPAGGNPFG